MLKRNWQSETDKIIADIKGEKPSLLLHTCCAPCGSASLEYLSKFFNIDVFFYNPNISTADEFNKRLKELERFIASAPFTEGIDIIAPEYAHNEFLCEASGYENEPERGARCERCFNLRLKETARVAEENNYRFFATTLTISPLKNADMINNIGLAVSGNSVYLPTDLKKKERYKRSIELSNEYGLYRQSFCGCEFSGEKIK